MRKQATRRRERRTSNAEEISPHFWPSPPAPLPFGRERETVCRGLFELLAQIPRGFTSNIEHRTSNAERRTLKVEVTALLLPCDGWGLSASGFKEPIGAVCVLHTPRRTLARAYNSQKTMKTLKWLFSEKNFAGMAARISRCVPAVALLFSFRMPMAHGALWLTNAPLNIERYAHTASLLPNGHCVLIAWRSGEQQFPDGSSRKRTTPQQARCAGGQQ